MTGSHAAAAERLYLRLVADYQSAILNYLYRLVGDVDVAEDLTQDTFVKAYRALDRLELDEAAEPRRRAWLYRIAQNSATDHLRRQARLRWLSLDSLRHQGGGDPGAEPPQRSQVRQVLAQLSHEQREVLLLFGYAGLDANEVGEVLGISPEAARKRRQRAREAFEAAWRRLTGEAP
jgi:RNA polymerase sigma-70 factor (ECF subfamily)